MPVAAPARKSLQFELKDAAKGTFRARFAVFNEVDKDGDVHAVGSFPVGKSVAISAYMHTSWDGALPVGKGVIGANDQEVWIDGQFFLDTQAGADTWKVVKELLGEMQWSYGYKVLEASFDAADLEPFSGARQLIKRQDVFEVSPVLVGAGSNTGTQWVKAAAAVGGKPAAKGRALVTQLKAATLAPEDAAILAQIDLLIDQADELVDTLMDKFGIPDPDEGPGDEADDPKSFSLIDHPKHALAGVASYFERQKSLADLRAKKQGKSGGIAISEINRERLAAFAKDLGDQAGAITAWLGDAPAPAADPVESQSDDELSSIWLQHQQRQAELGAAGLL